MTLTLVFSRAGTPRSRNQEARAFRITGERLLGNRPAAWQAAPRGRGDEGVFQSCSTELRLDGKPEQGRLEIGPQVTNLPHKAGEEIGAW